MPRDPIRVTWRDRAHSDSVSSQVSTLETRAAASQRMSKRERDVRLSASLHCVAELRQQCDPGGSERGLEALGNGSARGESLARSAV